MNPFERFQELRPRIAADEGLMGKLRTYASTSPAEFRSQYPVDALGHGSKHVHFRLSTCSGIWIATREFVLVPSPSYQRKVSEWYIDAAQQAHAEGRTVPAVCGGAVVERDGVASRYFLLVEDLTAGGTMDFRPARRGEEDGLRNGVVIAHDFDMPAAWQPATFRYMREGSMLQFDG